jgi:hypothetical protein
VDSADLPGADGVTDPFQDSVEPAGEVQLEPAF